MPNIGVGTGLPEALATKIETGGWIRTAHRGAPWIAPGNTLRSIEAALGFEVDLVEVDVHLTIDGRLALWHDDYVGAGPERLPIAEEKLDRLARFVRDALGERLVELSEALDIVRGRSGLMVDLKADNLGPLIADVARRSGVDSIVVCGDFWETLKELRSIAPEIGVSLTLDETWSEDTGGPRIEEIDTPAVTVDFRIVDNDFVQRCHERGIAVLAWTVDRVPLMRELLSRGIDGLTSNRCDLFSRL